MGRVAIGGRGAAGLGAADFRQEGKSVGTALSKLWLSYCSGAAWMPRAYLCQAGVAANPSQDSHWI